MLVSSIYGLILSFILILEYGLDVDYDLYGIDFDFDSGLMLVLNIRRYSWPRWSRGRTSLRRALWLIMFMHWFWLAVQARLVIQRVV